MLELHDDSLTKLTPGFVLRLQPSTVRRRSTTRCAWTSISRAFARGASRARLPDVRGIPSEPAASVLAPARLRAPVAERPRRRRWLARSADDIRAARAGGTLALFLGVEGSYAIDDDPEAGVARLAEAGVRFLGPLWERDSRAGTSCRTRAQDDRGLTEHGKRLVRALQRRRPAARRLARQQADLLGHSRDLANAAVLVALGRGGRAPAPAQPRRRSDSRARGAGRDGRGDLRGAVSRRHVLHARSPGRPHRARRAVGGDDCVALGSDCDGFMVLPRGIGTPPICRG